MSSATRLAVAGLIALACTGSLEPSDLIGDYTLTTVDGAPLPRLISAGDVCDVTLVSGSLELRIQDWSFLRLIKLEVCINDTAKVVPATDIGVLTRRDGRLYFETAHSLTDTLRFPMFALGPLVQLEVGDTALGLPATLHLGFGPRQLSTP